MDCAYGEKWTDRRWAQLVLGLWLLMQSVTANAWVVNFSNVSSGYSQCSWTDNGDGNVTVGVTIAFNTTAGNLGIDTRFLSRAVMIYLYDKTGVLQSSSLAATSVTLNGVKSNSGAQPGNYAIYLGSLTNIAGSVAPPPIPWGSSLPFSAVVTATIPKAKLANWLAVSIRAANFTSGNDVGEITGAAYISPTNTGGGCTKITDPTVNPPPPPPPLQMLALKVTTPDWDLGVLPRGRYQQPLYDLSQLLCFETLAKIGDISTARFVINATSDNPRIDARYQLINVADPTHPIPYMLTLTNATTGVITPLPNDSHIVIPLNDAVRNCFIPTFTTWVGDDVAGGTGAYSDRLTFTVVATP